MASSQTKTAGQFQDSQGTFEAETVLDQNQSLAETQSQQKPVKIPAHKQVLAALSPVFDAEFNGPLKKNGDVKIVGASPTAFTAFLSFFYEQQIHMRMDYVEDVMTLIDRYDVATAWPIVVGFLMKNLTTDDMLWGLSLAAKFRLDDLKAFCKSKIQSDCAKVCQMIELDRNAKPKLVANPNNRPMSEADLVCIFPQVFEAINTHSMNPRMTIDRQFKIDNSIIPFTLITGLLDNTFRSKVDETHHFTFSLNGGLLLTQLDFSSLYEICDGKHKPIECNVNMWIQEKDNQTPDSEPITLCTHAFHLNDTDENRVILPKPIVIKPDQRYTYRVYARIVPYSPPMYTSKTIDCKLRTELAPNKFISFLIMTNKNVLAKALYFRCDP